MKQPQPTGVSEVYTPQPRPFLKWVGGKGHLLRQFEPLFPRTFHSYYEPFVGSGAVFFHVQPPLSRLNDSNPNLVAAYKHIQSSVDDLLSLLHALQCTYHALELDQQKQRYYTIRELYNKLPVGTLEKTAYLIFLNKTGYNGLYRENTCGKYNVPFGRYRNPTLFDEQNIRAVSRALQQAEITSTPFDIAAETAQAGDFVYFDPPYMPLSKTSSFTSYTHATFALSQQIRLAEVARTLADRGVFVMLSNSNQEHIRELYKDFEQHEVQASRAINSKADLRGKITELVMTSYKLDFVHC